MLRFTHNFREKFNGLKKEHWGKVPPSFVKYSPLHKCHQNQEILQTLKVSPTWNAMRSCLWTVHQAVEDLAIKSWLS